MHALRLRMRYCMRACVRAWIVDYINFVSEGNVRTDRSIRVSCIAMHGQRIYMRLYTVQENFQIPGEF